MLFAELVAKVEAQLDAPESSHICVTVGKYRGRGVKVSICSTPTGAPYLIVENTRGHSEHGVPARLVSMLEMVTA